MKYLILFTFLFVATISKAQTANCGDPIDLKIDLELLKKASKIIKNNMKILFKNKVESSTIKLKKVDIKRFLKQKEFSNCSFLLRLFDKNNLTNNGYIMVSAETPIYFILKECGNYTHEILFDPYGQYSKGQSGDNRTYFKKGLSFGFSYTINFYDNTYENTFRQKD